jgi:hypothetical protein
MKQPNGAGKNFREKIITSQQELANMRHYHNHHTASLMLHKNDKKNTFLIKNMVKRLSLADKELNDLSNESTEVKIKREKFNNEKIDDDDDEEEEIDEDDEENYAADEIESHLSAVLSRHKNGNINNNDNNYNNLFYYICFVI